MRLALCCVRMRSRVIPSAVASFSRRAERRPASRPGWLRPCSIRSVHSTGLHSSRPAVGEAIAGLHGPRAPATRGTTSTVASRLDCRYTDVIDDLVARRRRHLEGSCACPGSHGGQCRRHRRPTHSPARRLAMEVPHAATEGDDDNEAISGSIIERSFQLAALTVCIALHLLENGQRVHVGDRPRQFVQQTRAGRSLRRHRLRSSSPCAPQTACAPPARCACMAARSVRPPAS